MDSLGRIPLKYYEKVAKGATREGISSKVRRLVKRHPSYDYPMWLAESHLDNKMQSRGDKTRVVCSRGRSRTLHAHVSYTRRDLRLHLRTLLCHCSYICTTVIENSRKNHVCLQRSGKILGQVHPPHRNLAHATEISAKRFSCTRYNRK